MSQDGNPTEKAQEAPAVPDPSPVTIFVNYRREDTSGYARALYQELKLRFGSEQVFMDTASIAAGESWLQAIKARTGASGVFLALIGRDWLRILDERSRQDADDFVRLEIEGALKRGSATRLIPVVVDGAPMPGHEALRWPSLRGLASIQATRLRQASWDDDVARLLERIVAVSEGADSPPVAAAELETTRPSVQPGNLQATITPPDASHYQAVANYLVDANRVYEPVVVFLGSGVNASDRGDERWRNPESGWLPDDDALAEHLAAQFGVGPRSIDLAQVSQYVYLTEGGSPLYKTLKKILAADCPPTSVHRFLAGLPAALEELGYPQRYQLIVSTNYDDALERAFDDANEPYDLAVYIASGDRKGKFVHIPHDGDAQLVEDPAAYRRFPIDAGDEIPLKRTVIVKIHGAIDSQGDPWRENYVITEDQYIDYLVDGDIPSELAAQIKGSHCLFVGYTMRDWNFRVFLKRMWRGRRLEATSWAVEREPDEMEGRFWNSLGVDLVGAPLDEYFRQLASFLAAHRKAAAER